jgi:hypothetical protein
VYPLHGTNPVRVLVSVGLMKCSVLVVPKSPQTPSHGVVELFGLIFLPPYVACPVPWVATDGRYAEAVSRPLTLSMYRPAIEPRCGVVVPR